MTEKVDGEGEFPVAMVSEAKRPWWTTMSKMWLVSLACLILAIGLTYYASDSPGTELSIRFTEGHGLKPGDAIRHRGIEIGQVERVALAPTLRGIEVTAVLHDNAKAIACEGSRFWIVRPQLNLTGVSGLETAVGSKYIGVIPGDSPVPKTEFAGLDEQPADPLQLNGLEIILRGADRFGVNPGSPLTWRGIEVGRVLSSSLSPDASQVDTRVRIDEPYRKLLSRDSRFWVTSGIQMDLNMSGFELSTESLQTIASGGIGFITPSSTSSQDVQPGDVFTLHEKLDKTWLDSAAAVDLMELDAPPVATVIASWRQKHFGIPRSHETRASALTIATDAGARVLMPSDLLLPEGVSAEDYALAYRWPGSDQPLSIGEAKREADSLIISLPLEQATPASLLSADRVRTPEGPEDCFAVRRSWQDGNDPATVMEMIGQDQLLDDGTVWRSTNRKLSRDMWHGAVVVSSLDEKVIGMLIVTDTGPQVVKLPVP
jgi:paraquat-inducible protein B